MAASHFISFRAATCWLLVSVLVLPAMGADAPPKALADIMRGSALEVAAAQPGTLAAQDTPPQSVVQQPAEQTPAAAAPAKHHRTWVWVAVIAGIAVGAGTAIIVTNRQSGRTSPPTPGVTVNVGGASAGAP